MWEEAAAQACRQIDTASKLVDSCLPIQTACTECWAVPLGPLALQGRFKVYEGDEPPPFRCAGVALQPPCMVQASGRGMCSSSTQGHYNSRGRGMAA